MLPQIKISCFLIIYLLFFSFSSFSGRAHNFREEGMELSDKGNEGIMYTMNKGGRKLIGVEANLDYADPVANPIHEPPRRGGRG